MRTTEARVNIQNCPERLREKYIVARFDRGKLWYYGNYPKDRAEEVFKELDNSLIVEVG